MERRSAERRDAAERSQPESVIEWKGRFQAVVCALVLVALVLLARPQVELGMVDEWSYAFSAKLLAQTGRVEYNGWGAMPLTWVLYWCALLIRVFGFSFTVVRWGMLLVSAVTVFVMHRVLRRSGLSETYSTLGTLTMLLAPSFYSNAPMLMSDIPGFLALLLCFYGVLRALRPVGRSGATRWLVFASVANTAVGSCRQIALLGVLLLVPCAWWRLRDKVRTEIMAPAWAACVVAVALLLRWFARQPYTVHEPLLPKALTVHMLSQFFHVPLGLVTFLLPLPVMFVASMRWRNHTVRCVMGATALLLVGAFLVLRRPGLGVLKAPYLFDTLTLGGFHDVDRMVGVHVREFGTTWQASVTCLTWFLLVGVALYAVCPMFRRGEANILAPAISSRALLAVFGPFVAVYFALYATRLYPFDRYLLPLMLLLTLLSLRLLQQQGVGRSAASWAIAAMVLVAGFDVAALHDVFARYRAREAAIAELQAVGIPRDRIDGGFEFDGWTELERTGYVKWPSIHLPSGALVGSPSAAPISECVNWFIPFTPSVVPQYAVARSALACLQPTVPPVRYETWLTPGSRTLVAGKVVTER